MQNKIFLTFVCLGVLFNINNLFAAPPDNVYEIVQNCAVGEVGENWDFSCLPCPSGYTSDAGTFAGGDCYYQDLQDIQNCFVESGYCYRATVTLTNNTSCNVDNLETSTNGSTAQTEAIWNANTININWYNGDMRVAQTTCEYDGVITLPTPPSKPGYTFAGWVLKQN